MINPTGVTSGTGIANPSEAPEFTPVYFGGFIGGVCVGQSSVRMEGICFWLNMVEMNKYRN
jgi:hypothetical protein